MKKLLRKELNWAHDPFDIPNDVYKYFEEFVNKKIASYEKLKNNEKIDFRESDFSKSFAEPKSSSVKENISTRDSSGVILNKLSEDSNLFIGGSADLAGSTKTYINSSTSINSTSLSSSNFI